MGINRDKTASTIINKSFHAMLNDLDYYVCYQMVIFDWAHESAMRNRGKDISIEISNVTRTKPTYDIISKVFIWIIV